MELATLMNQYNKHCDNWQMRPADIPMDKKLVSSDPKDVAAVDDYKAIALRIAKLLDTSSSVPEQHMIDSIAELVDLEKQLAQVSVLHDDVIKWKHFPRYWTFVREFTVTSEFPSQRPVTRSFDVSFDLCLNKLLSKQSWGWWFETSSRSLWRHCDACIITMTSQEHHGIWNHWKLDCFLTFSSG